MLQADLIRVMHGTPAYEEYLDEMQQKHEADARKHEADARKLAKQKARRKTRCAAIKKVYRRLIAIVTKVKEDR